MLQNWLMLTGLIVLGACLEPPERTSCGPGDLQPPSRVNTTQILHELRSVMVPEQLDAFIVTTEDEHQCEFVAPSSRRLHFITGFSGSAGTAIITKSKAILWTDGRYHIQADIVLDCNWILMRSGLPNVPNIHTWLSSEYPKGAKIGADSKLIAADWWNTLEEKLSKNCSCELVKTQKNLVDEIWKDKPKIEENKAFVLGDFFSGENWQHKVNRTRVALKSTGADAIILTALDDIAWLLNLRGSDIPFTPVVNSYVFLSNSDIILFLDSNKVPFNFSEVYEPKGLETVKRMGYDRIWSIIPSYAERFNKIIVPTKKTFNLGASKAIFDLVPPNKKLSEPSVVIDLKAVKNPTEIRGMQHAHVIDAVALCEFFEYFEDNLCGLDEFKVAQLVDEFRAKQVACISPSFTTIAAYGQNSASPHYTPTEETTQKIVNGSLLLIDSGGQYLGGTTDITRTLSIGDPTPEQKLAYTHVLMGAIELSSLIFPSTLNTSQIDLLARAPLWELGYDYMHGTGHGVAPININYMSTRGQILKPGYFTSIEPGIYLEGKFGVRLENVVKVVNKTDLKYTTEGISYLGFKDVTLVPYDMKLIDFSILSRKHIKWLQKYYKRILLKVGQELKRLKKHSTYNWLTKQLDSINSEFDNFGRRNVK